MMVSPGSQVPDTPALLHNVRCCALCASERCLRTPALLAASYKLTFSYMRLHFPNCLQVRCGKKTTRGPYKQEAVDVTVRTEFTSRITAARISQLPIRWPSAHPRFLLWQLSWDRWNPQECRSALLAAACTRQGCSTSSHS